MTARGIRSVFYFQVDNPLVDIADPAFIGLHMLQSAELSLKLCLKSSPTEKMGQVTLLDNGRIGMIEYSELTPKQAARFIWQPGDPCFLAGVSETHGAQRHAAASGAQENSLRE